MMGEFEEGDVRVRPMGGRAWTAAAALMLLVGVWLSLGSPPLWASDENVPHPTPTAAAAATAEDPGEATGASEGASAGRRGSVARTVRDVWEFSLFTVREATITVGKIVKALLFLVLGVWLARWASKIAGTRVLRRVGLDRGAAAAAQVLTRYTLLILVVVTALWLSGIPLTIFTLLGGAVAIGLGFGSQNILANFISGLILLFERPIKVGDLVEVESMLGVVEKIGARSTQIKSFDNIHVVVPNSKLLENPVTNWTLSDHEIRVKLTVGVAYGSPVRRVEELMLRAIREHPKVLDEPEPAVLFSEFGDSALIFEGYVWIRMRVLLERLRIMSDIRFRIDELFREAGVVIAFPQRDVHLDSLSPLRVQMVGAAAEEEVD